MFTIEADKTINVTRGDILYFSVMAEGNGVPYTFKAGDIVRISVYGKNACENVVLQKDFLVTESVDTIEIYLNKEDTKIGEIINKQKDYWYEIVLNPDTAPQTIIGYDDDGAKVFRLYPEGEDVPVIEEDKEVLPEEIPIIDDELDLFSNRPVRNKAITRAIVNGFEVVNNAINETKENLDKFIEESKTTHKDITGNIKNVESSSADERKKIIDDLAVERERIDNIGKVLFEGVVSSGNEIEFDASKYSLFAITVHSAVADCVVFCGKTEDVNGYKSIAGSNTASLVNSLQPVYFRVWIQIAESGNKHTVAISQISDKADFAESAGTLATPIVKIIGIV